MFNQLQIHLFQADGSRTNQELKTGSKFGLQNLFPSINFEWKQFGLNFGIINIPQEFFSFWLPISKFHSGFRVEGC